MYTDVQTYFTTCSTCQKTSTVRQRGRAPLHPLPIISTPFRRIAMDIVGPLEKSSAGHRYILVICDYATRYPEAFALRTITTPEVMHALTPVVLQSRHPNGDSNQQRYELHFPPDEAAPPATGYHRGENQSPTTHKPTDWWRDSIRH